MPGKDSDELVTHSGASHPPIDASVIIPVKNGAEFLDEVLTAISAQVSQFAFEVLVIDSGSSDDSLQIAARHNVTLVTIPPHEFNHGETRNLNPPRFRRL